MHQDAWVVSQSHPSCCGNVMETPGSFQVLSTMVMMWQRTEASALAHSQISRCVTALTLQRFEGHNLHWDQNERRRLRRYLRARNCMSPVAKRGVRRAD